MTDYTKLVKALRCCGNEGFHKCPYQKHIHEKFCWVIAMKDAADAIEALQAEAEKPITLEQAIDRLHELGWLQEHDRILTEPKRGEWIGRQNHKKCSVCGLQAIYDVALQTDMKTPYCPHCGAKMEVQE